MDAAVFFKLSADGSKATPVPGGDAMGDVYAIQETKAGIFVQGSRGLLKLSADGSKATLVPGGGGIGFVHAIQETKAGIFVGGDHGLFRLSADGSMATPVPGGDARGTVFEIWETKAGIFVRGDNGFLKLSADRSKATPVPGGDTIGLVLAIQETEAGIFVAAARGLYRLEPDGSKVTPFPGGDARGLVRAIQETRAGILIGGEFGLLMVRHGPLENKIALTSPRSSDNPEPNQHIPTRWTINHPCARFADQWGLEILVKNADQPVLPPAKADGFESTGESGSFYAIIPIAKDGDWTFQIHSRVYGSDISPTQTVTFRTPGTIGFLQRWGLTTGIVIATVLAVLNLLVFVAARYSPKAWQLASDESWKAALLPQRLLLRHLPSAQLWLLDLYVQQERKARANQPPERFLPIPLTGDAAESFDPSKPPTARSIWVQGNAGMGKSAIFEHLLRVHFTGEKQTSFSIFKRYGFILVPIHAREFSTLTVSDAEDSSAWIVACIRKVLSSRVLSFNDRTLISDLLRTGTMGVAIDGLNEVARDAAVAAFVKEFPEAFLFVTSQESGQPPFQVWHLPPSIADYVDALLVLYMGEQSGSAVAHQIRETGLINHLRSGYDVRLVIDLAINAPTRLAEVKDQLSLYYAAVEAGWPKNDPRHDERLEQLQAAAWKLVSERDPNQDKRRISPDQDCPATLLSDLEKMPTVRLIRLAPPGYEFVHDQMHWYLAACWLCSRATVATMRDLLTDSKVWKEGWEAQRVLWTFVAEMLDKETLEKLWRFAGEDERRAVLGSALAKRAAKDGWTLTQPPS